MRKPLLLLSAVLIALAGAYAAAGYWLLPGYVSERLVAEAARLGYELRLGAVRTDPFRLRVELQDAQLAVAGNVDISAQRVRAHLRLGSLLARDFLPQRVILSRGAVDLAGTRIEPVELALQRQSDGAYRVTAEGPVSLQGSLALAPLRLDAEVSASDLPLAAVQPWIEQVARLDLASGTAAARGRLRFDAAGTPRLAYAGALSLRDVSLRGAEPTAPPLASWRSLESSDVVLTVAPNRLQVGEVLLQRPAGRLVIGEDSRVNLSRVAKGGKTGAAAFPVSVRRLTVRDGQLEFADLTLQPRFATTIRELSGVVSGLGNDGDDEARVELDGRVDQYGSARIRGTLNPFRPKTRTSVTMSFRNLEMKALTPYSAKFAGYRIESGKLSADLRYRVRNSRLVGDNRVVIDRLVLGERVEGSKASELPIELAIALLTDAKGRIELGLPVSGDLSDPEFSVAQLAGKVFGNLLERIASAPFRLLGSLLGGGRDRDLDGIVFEPGSARLDPPQQENAAALARALAARPQVSLAVHGGYDGEADTAALRGLALRRELVKRSGFRLPGGGDPGSLDPSDPRTRQAMETLYIEHGGTAMAMREIRRAAEKEAQDPRAEKQAAGDPRAAERRYLRELSKQISAKLPLPAGAGEALAHSRAEAVRSALLARGVAPERVRIGEPTPSAAEGTGVRTALVLDPGGAGRGG